MAERVAPPAEPRFATFRRPRHAPPAYTPSAPANGRPAGGLLSAAGAVLDQPGGRSLLPYVVMIAAWVFDFQAQDSGQGLAIQAIFLATYLFGFFYFLSVDGGQTMPIPGATAFYLAGGFYAVVAISSALARGLEFYLTLRFGFIQLLYLTMSYATIMVVIKVPPRTLRLVLGGFALLFAFSRVMMLEFVGHRVDFSETRFEIQGSSTYAAFGFIALMLAFRLRRLEMGALGVTVVLGFLSVTRTLVLVAVVQLLALLRSLRTVLNARFVLFLVVGAVALVILFKFGGSGLVRWTDRVNQSQAQGAQDNTFVTRYSEWIFMWQSFTSSISNLLFGAGISARTLYYLPWSRTGATEYSIGFGHNQHLSLLFNAGLVGGLPLLLVQTAQVWRAFRFSNQITRIGRDPGDLVFLGTWGAMIVIGTFTANFLSSVFGDRGFTLWYAIGTGLLLGVQACFAPSSPQIQAIVARRAVARAMRRQTRQARGAPAAAPAAAVPPAAGAGRSRRSRAAAAPAPEGAGER